MISFFVWLFIIFALLLLVARSYPQEVTNLLTKWKRHLHFRYANKYGKWAADRDIPLLPWQQSPLDADEPDSELDPTQERFYAYLWPHFLKAGLGLIHLPPDIQLPRRRLLFWGLMGWLVDHGWIRMKGLTPLRTG